MLSMSTGKQIFLEAKADNRKAFRTGMALEKLHQPTGLVQIKQLQCMPHHEFINDLSTND